MNGNNRFLHFWNLYIMYIKNPSGVLITPARVIENPGWRPRWPPNHILDYNFWTKRDRIMILDYRPWFTELTMVTIPLLAFKI